MIANEDYTGVNPTYPPATAARRSTPDVHVDALRAAGYSADVWDVDTQGVPHDLGVLSHYKAVVWYLGDNRLTQDPEDVFTDTLFGAAARHRGRRAPAVPDDGGARLPQRGRQAHPRRRDRAVLRPARQPTSSAASTTASTAHPSSRVRRHDVQGLFDDCLLLADDFRQYYLGAFSRVEPRRAGHRFDGIASADQRRPRRPGRARRRNPLDEAGVFQPTSDVLPVAQFPQFAQPGRRGVQLHAASPFAPVEGTQLRRRACTPDDVLHAADADVRPDRRSTAASSRRCSSSCPTTPSRATTT